MKAKGIIIIDSITAWNEPISAERHVYIFVYRYQLPLEEYSNQFEILHSHSFSCAQEKLQYSILSFANYPFIYWLGRDIC